APDEAKRLSDAALALKTWEVWQQSALERWVGDFAFILWDNSEQTIYAARDQLGHRTLSYYVTPQRLIIASAPKGIFAVGGVPRELDEQKIADALGQLYSDASRSFYKDVNRLPPAHLLIASAFTCQIRRYWSLDNVPDVRFASDDD